MGARWSSDLRSIDAMHLGETLSVRDFSFSLFGKLFGGSLEGTLGGSAESWSGQPLLVGDLTFYFEKGTSRMRQREGTS